MSKQRVVTQDFFKKVQGELNERRFKMAIITEQHGWQNIQAMYEDGQHGALIDAFVLSKICCGMESSLRIRFGEWLSLARTC